MKNAKNAKTYLLLIPVIFLFSVMACSPLVVDPDPAVTATIPDSAAASAAISAPITATFNKTMDSQTIIAANFTVFAGATPVPGTVSYDAANKTAIFTPSGNLEHLTTYTATITTGVMDTSAKELGAARGGKQPIADKVWTFTTAGHGPAPVLLGSAGNYAILAKTGVSTLTSPLSAITGNVGVSPNFAASLTGFSLTLAGVSATSAQVTGLLYAADMTSPTPSDLTTAIGNMETAYTDAAGRSTPDFLNLGAGNIGGLTLVPGLYTWGTTVTIPTDITLAGGPNDVWIFQVAGSLTVANATRIKLSGGARAQRIFWQVASGASLGTTAHFEGIILCQTAITLATGATMNGRTLAQTAVTLQSNTITQP